MIRGKGSPELSKKLLLFLTDNKVETAAQYELFRQNQEQYFRFYNDLEKHCIQKNVVIMITFQKRRGSEKYNYRINIFLEKEKDFIEDKF